MHPLPTNLTKMNLINFNAGKITLSINTVRKIIIKRLDKNLKMFIEEYLQFKNLKKILILIKIPTS